MRAKDNSDNFYVFIQKQHPRKISEAGIGRILAMKLEKNY